MQRLYKVASFYKFHPVESPDISRVELISLARTYDVKGLVILAPEGFNATVSCRAEQEREFLSEIFSCIGCEPPLIKWSESERHVFRRFVVKVRSEIVTTGTEVPVAPDEDNQMLSPQEFRSLWRNRPDVLVLDVRNRYEHKLGRFSGSVEAGIDEFAEFSDFLRSSDIPRDTTVLTYCTGGIRCEKARRQMIEHGFKDVYQLEGGILSYLGQFPNDGFEGECFVFDDRVAVDQNLRSSTRYTLCKGCGEPVSDKCFCNGCDQARGDRHEESTSSTE